MSVLERIKKIDWEEYSGSPWYKPEDVSPALMKLATLSDTGEANCVGHMVLSTIGNDHAGTYYPAIQAALDIIIAIAEQADNQISKMCALGILDDLISFEPDIEGYSKISAEQLDSWVYKKLRKYEQ
ncbi:hypothetical protein [Marinicella rhabdoformis]|uniref:hypothetical protein n=1 Tax=Marinicella rhabdoformis TaxID=2580566 RepID=UPI0012AEC809|nr:hypothetical protein [Marinicella rhabdoformis]